MNDTGSVNKRVGINLTGTDLNSFSWPEGRSAGMHEVNIEKSSRKVYH